MLIIHQIISDIEAHLENLLLKANILDYRIVYHLTNEIRVYILADSKSSIVSSLPHNDNKMINYTIIAQSEKENDPYWADIFTDKGSKLDKSLRRRFDNILSDVICRPKKTIPVISFYSYKGGTGRTTTLASFASYYAMHCKKRIIVLDCDFEAPGLNNFFGISDEVFAQKSGGIIEFLNDIVFKSDANLEGYYIRASSKFAGDGSIFVFPAGNLSQEHIEYSCNRSYSHFDAYLEALSRINISSKEYIVQQFKNLLDRIATELNPDIVLIDTRTGFNDVYANIALSFSDFMLGFFGCDIQTVPGYQWFIENTYRTGIQAISVNSISSTSEYSIFLNNIHNPAVSMLLSKGIIPIDIQHDLSSAPISSSDRSIEQNNINDNSSIPIIPTYFVSTNQTLAMVGTSEIAEDSYIQLIKNESFPDYNNIFSDVKELIENQKCNPEKHSINENMADVQNSQDMRPSSETLTLLEQHDDYLSSSLKSMRDCQKELLLNLSQNLPNSYGEDTTIDDSFVNRSLFYRESMNDLLNKDKFLLIGNKGTGKTLLYKAFTNAMFVDILTERFGDKSKTYIFVNVLSAQPGGTSIIDNSSIRVPEQISSDDFYKSFWFVLVWNVVFSRIEKFPEHIEPSLPLFKITNERITALAISEIVVNDVKMTAIETDMKKLDEVLNKHGRKLVVSFDQLDYVFKPTEWDKAVAPLIKYWRNHPYQNIIPKIFVRSDLYRKLGNITNKEQLTRRSISLEWSKDELYGFFFKTLFSINDSKEIFFQALSLSGIVSKEQVERLYASCSDYQIPNSENDLKTLVTCFFGVWADYQGVSQRFGTCYDWFYTNLMNADKTISLRPFIDLIDNAVDKALLESNYLKRPSQPILHQSFFTDPYIRSQAVERHINDLGQEEGNKDLLKFRDFIRSDAPMELKKFSLRKRDFDNLMQLIFNRYGQELESRNADDLRTLLEVNGFVYQYYSPGGYTFYSFAYLYKYYLGLQTDYAMRKKNKYKWQA